LTAIIDPSICDPIGPDGKEQPDAQQDEEVISGEVVFDELHGEELSSDFGTTVIL
jgi:hypothetical protein